MLSFQAITMELLTFGLGVILLLVKLLTRKGSNLPYGWITVLGLVIIGVIGIVYPPEVGITFGGMYYTDNYSLFFKEMILVCAVLISLCSTEYVKKKGYKEAEYYILIVFATLGMMVFTSAGDLITLYVGLELMTMSFIVLIGIVRRNALSSEASIKYLVLSALSSAVMLYGISLIYGFMGTTVFLEMAMNISVFSHTAFMVLGVLLFLVGFAYKLSAVPFHMWAPDIYQGAPTPVAGFLAVGAKVATLGVLCRLLFNYFVYYAESWLTVIIALAMLSIIFGNLVAIPQRDVKRMLAYSSIAQVGYLLLAVAAANTMGIIAICFYVAAYAFANIGAFIAASNVELATGTTDMKKYAGMSKRSPLIAAGLFIFMISLGGLPPTGGFIGKFLIFTSTIQSGYLIFSIIALLFSMISVYYYLRLVRECYFAPVPEGVEQTKIKSPIGIKIALAICMIASIAMGLFFNPMVEAGANALSTMQLF
ncbi:MAG: NADH-quinone oxidoreductase subunit N [Peptococcaceae bacterium]|nr:NADH-quinone oxidoreductase subunit N [Peptococcaceae bacterium]